MSEPKHSAPDLSQSQLALFEGFMSGHLPQATRSPNETWYYEQATAHLRDAVDRSEIDLSSRQRAYDLMVGLSIGTLWVEGLMEHDPTVEKAGRVMRVSLAQLLFSRKMPGDATLESSIQEVDMDIKEELDPRVAETLKPEETAIIVVDVMDGYCNPEEPLPKYLKEWTNATYTELDKAADKMAAFLDASRNQPIATTVFARMVERPDTSPPNIRLKMEVDKAPPVVERGGQGWAYYKVKPHEGDHEIVKYSYDSFIGTDLDEHLKSHGVKTVIIMGGYASVCVESTARTAAQLGYNTFVPADLTADPGKEGQLQTPNIIRSKLSTINNVMGYMPLASTILEVWQN
jgi:nicotinamidase-related amidase